MFNFMKFLKHFLLSGIIVGTFAYFSETTKNKLCALLYCGLPIGFLYMFLFTFMNRKEQYEYTFDGMIGTIFFLLYMLFFYVLLKYTKLNVFIIILLTLITFFILLFFTNKFFYKLF